MKQDKPSKTNAARMLDSLGIDYEIRTYKVDPDDLTAITVATRIGLPPEQVFKTLLTKVTGAAPREASHLFAVVPGNAELDLKKLAQSAGVRKVELAARKEVEPLTGYVRGGVTVFGARTAFPVYADETLELFDRISVSAGQRGIQILLSPADFIHAAEAVLADISKPVAEQGR
jgi:Cys-tRNA(Pro)/Cys-tRNA(Cys) deacylase